MVTIRCQQCNKEFLAKRRSAKFCSALCRQRNWRERRPQDYLLRKAFWSMGYIIKVSGAKTYVLPRPDVTPEPSPRFWELMQDALKEARLVAGSTLGAILAASIIVMDGDAEIVGEWELDGKP